MISELSKLNLQNTSNFRIIDDRYKILSTIGSGRFGNVYLVHDSFTERLMALKELKEADSIAALDNFLLEIEILLKIKRSSPSSSVISLLGFGISPDVGAYYTTNFSGLSNFFEFMEGTGRMTEDHARYFFHQLVKTVSELHKVGYAHLDLKPENILINEQGKMIICDFGSAKKLGHNADAQISCSQEYTAPEVLESQGMSGATQKFSKIDMRSLDSFSLGVVLFVMMFKSNPFRKADMSDPYFRRFITDPSSFWKVFANLRQISKELKGLLEELLISPGDHRPTPLQLLKHPWLIRRSEDVMFEENLVKELRIHFFEKSTLILEKLEEKKKNTLYEKNGIKLKEVNEVLRRFVRTNEKKMKKLKELLLEGGDSSDSASASGDTSPL